MKHFADWDEHTLNLCVDRFTVGLGHDDEAALGRLANSADQEEFERAVAAAHLALLTHVEAPPVEILARLEAEGRQLVGPNASTGRSTGSESGRAIAFPREAFPRSVLPWAGWLVAAALLFMLLPFGGSEYDPLNSRERLVADATDLVRASWTATEDAAAVGASGDVVWSSSRQEGYMRFQGLAPNDPAKDQYQLWVFDPTRADWEAKPVDGGVFDVPNRGEVVVPINAKLGVAETALFAVTIEVPGGVVVSERERLVLTASP